ncbi:lipoprotein intramolecular transacylase Lit [Bacilliculturomica massiliensis]|uniref:lipoprotein intramolecular transacylase Lit n=1 Tax=Bacilliculturomica massiliensis TaxID=1917867 RepID=UPI0013EF235A|nr:DUF1461 domain-containing protein [Bacilliculturomica massiliensis]
MVWVKRVLLCWVVFLLPLVILAGAVNLIVRMPDFYQFEFNRTETPKTINLNVKNDDFADFFSDFMWGKKKEFELLVANDATDQEESVFPPEEQAAMERFRTILNLVSMAGAVALLPAAAAYYLWIRDGGKEQLRRAFLASVALLVVYAGFCVFGLLSPGPSEFLKDVFMGGSFSEDGLLYYVFTKKFVLHGAAAAGAVTAIIYLVVGMATWSVTRPYRMFGRDRRTRR